VATLRPVLRSAAALAILALAFVTGCGGDDDDSDAGARKTTSATAGAGGCKRAEAPAPRREGGQQRPKSRLDPAKTYDVTFDTNCGSFTVRLDQKTSPATATSFAALVKSGFFDGTVFHRIVPGFVIQGGDPTGTGSGGPGYSTRNRPPAGATYTRGVVAMAKNPTEPPGTAGSQFYVVTGADAGLSADYALLGKVTKGQGATARIDALGDPRSGDVGTPLEPVVIEKASLRVR
jgi:peptidyl-prolyl cis-trans isomerase B (cyclophilin B)